MSVDPEVIAAHWPQVFAFVRTMMPRVDEQTVEDVASAALEKALRASHRFEPRADAKLTTWLYLIARNAVRDHWKWQRYRHHPPLGEYGRATLDAGSDRHADVLDIRQAITTLNERQQAYCQQRMADVNAYRACENIGVAKGNGAGAYRFYSAAHAALRAAMEGQS